MNMRSHGAGSRYVGELPQGCKMCKKGAKLVLLITGRCAASCYYCPLSLKKKGRDVIYANEMKIKDVEGAITEARLIDAEGTGITGGDPLEVLDRTIMFIKRLKDEFGKDHHIHLYTATINTQAFKALEASGLDELRIHPPLHMWRRLEETSIANFVANTNMDVGFEIPAIPDTKSEIVELVSYASRAKMDFVNLNELEVSETNWRRLKAKGFEVKNDISSAVLGSEELAIEILKLDLEISRHYCSSAFKDRIQMRNRIKRRAKNIARAGDIITKDGTLLKGVIEGDKLREISDCLISEFEVPKELIYIDRSKKRIEIAPWILEEISSFLPYNCYIIEEYPTADRLEVEREQLPSQAKQR